MSTAQICVSWMSYKNCISKGFSRLQQNGEFVDMTLAADGHLIKVHQNIVALASPYLKAMIQSAACQHPVVFLNNVTQEMLCFILEYIYTGEVKIPTESTHVFIETCRALHINGVENLYLPKKPAPESMSENLDASIKRPTMPPDNNFAAHITINSDNNVEVIPLENSTTQDIIHPLSSLDLDNANFINYPPLTSAAVEKNEKNTTQENIPLISLDHIELLNYQPPTSAVHLENISNTDQDFEMPTISLGNKIDFEPPSEAIEVKEKNQSKILINNDINVTGQSLQNVLLNLRGKETLPITCTVEKDPKLPTSIKDKDNTLHYSISNRGSLQLLLNRFIYHCHHHSCEGRKRRWRCVEYRKLHCPAFIDTDNGNIVDRSENHSHSCDTAKIMKKFKSKLVFTSITLAEDKIRTPKKKAPKSKYKKHESIP